MLYFTINHFPLVVTIFKFIYKMLDKDSPSYA